MKIKFILAKLLHKWSTNLDLNVINSLEHSKDCFMQLNNKNLSSQELNSIYEKIQKDYSYMVNNGLGNSHLTKFLSKELEIINERYLKQKDIELKEENNTTLDNLTCDIILQNAIDKAKEKIHKEKIQQQKVLNHIKQEFIKQFKEKAFDVNYSFEAKISLEHYVSSDIIEKYLKDNIPFIKNCWIHVNNNITKNCCYTIIDIKYKN